MVAAGEGDLALEVQPPRLGERPGDGREEGLDLGPALRRLLLLPEPREADRLHGVPLGEELRRLHLLAEDALDLDERLAVAAELRLEPRAEEARPDALLDAEPVLRPLRGEPSRRPDVAAVERRHREGGPALPALAGVVGGHEPLRHRLRLAPLLAQGVGHEAAGLDLRRVVGAQRRGLVEGGERGVDAPLRELEEREVLEGGGAVGVLLRVALEGLARALGAPGGDVGLGEAHVAAGERHPAAAQLLEVHEGLGVAPQVDQDLGEVVAGRGVVGVGVHRLLVGGGRLLDRAGVERVVPPLDVEPLAGGQVARLLHRLRRVGPGLLHVPEVAVDDRQLGEGHREAGVLLDRLLEPGLRLSLLQPVVEAAALGVRLHRADRGGGDLLQLLLLPLPLGVADLAGRRGRLGRRAPRPRPHRRLDAPPHAAGQVVHQREQAALRVALHALGGDHLAGARVLDRGLDADLRAGAHEAADERGRGLGPPRDRVDHLGRDGPVVAVAVLLEQLVEAARAHDAHPGRLREVRHEHVREPRAQPVEAGVPGEVVEVEDGHRRPPVARGRGRFGAEEEGRHRREQDERRARRERQRPAPAPLALGLHARAPRRRAEHDLAGVDVALQVLEVAAQVARGLVAVLRPLLEGPLDHPGERAGDVVAQLADRPRGVLEDRGEDRQVRVAAEGALAGRDLVEEDAEREDVGAVVDGKALRLLGGHVGDRSHDAPVLGDGAGLARRAVLLVGVVAQLGEAEVEHLDPPVRGEHHVVGLEVAVQDPLAVGGGHRVDERDREREDALGREAPRGDRLAERLALDVLHRQEAQPLGLLDRVERHDPGVAERGDRPRLALEARDLLGVRGHLRRQHLEGDPAVEARVVGEVDLAHPARAERLEEAIGPQRPADEAAVGLRLWHDADYDAPGGRADPPRHNC